MTHISSIPRKYFFICLVSLFLGVPHLAAQLKEGNAPVLEQCKVTSLEQLMSAARYTLQKGIDPPLKRGDSLLIVDNNYHPWILEALERAAEELGLNTSVVKVMRRRDAGGNTLWPKWFEEAFWSSDGVVASTGVRLSFPMEQRFQRAYNRVYSIMPETLENFAYLPWSTFPQELDYAIQKKFHEFVNLEGGPRHFHLTDPGGTDLTWTMEMDRQWVEERFPTNLYKWDYALIRFASYLHDHGMLNPSGSKIADAKGVVATTVLHSGPIPMMRMYMESGKITRIEGGGAAGEDWKSAIQRYKDLDYKMPHGVGTAMWLEEVSVGTSPKQRNPIVCSPDYYKYKENVDTRGSWPSYRNWTQGLRRAGVMHLGFGKGWHPGADRQGQYKVTWHRDIELYFPTLTVEGRKLIDHGHLTVLDDPEIRRLAAKYGDPDALLKVEWIPPHWDPNRW
ncbi:MAG: hypothetical protein HY644_00015 [Acidobacteria bacterium]|nr:hypothetical protein [Acidobacteriota bacterium]